MIDELIAYLIGLMTTPAIAIAFILAARIRRRKLCRDYGKHWYVGDSCLTCGKAKP